jgi:ABC-type multidrug transport system ATPase subunit
MKSWPATGEIELRDVEMRYRDGLPLVLKRVTASIRGGERIGICGRTGSGNFTAHANRGRACSLQLELLANVRSSSSAVPCVRVCSASGKSSMMVALFRLVELCGGAILIDGVDISKIGLHTLRSRMAIIPQDATLFSGTIRSNLDPFAQHTDEEILFALEKAHIAEKVRTLQNGLEASVAEAGENFSLGERSLLTVARAMLRRARIVVADEASASIDLKTDELIQRSLREEFGNCTILTIAHRLNTIGKRRTLLTRIAVRAWRRLSSLSVPCVALYFSVDYDRVMVMADGVIREFDSPAALLRNPASLFSALVTETGDKSAAFLRAIAFEAESKNVERMAKKHASSSRFPALAAAPDSGNGERKEPPSASPSPAPAQHAITIKAANDTGYDELGSDESDETMSHDDDDDDEANEVSKIFFHYSTDPVQ